jgi:hypothetical protein
MNHRGLFLAIASIAALAARHSTSAGQEVTAATVPGTLHTFHEDLAFSKDGHFLREVGTVSTDGTQQNGQIGGCGLLFLPPYHTRTDLPNAQQARVTTSLTL